jgi:hypothetical protein
VRRWQDPIRTYLCNRPPSFSGARSNINILSASFYLSFFKTKPMFIKKLTRAFKCCFMLCLLAGVGTSPIWAEVPSAPGEGKQVILKSRPLKLTPEQRQQFRALLADQLIVGNLKEARTLAVQLNSLAFAIKDTESEADKETIIWREYYLAALSIMASQPDKGVVAARRIEALIEAGIPQLTDEKKARAYELLGDLRYLILGDSANALVAHESAATLRPPSPEQKQRIDEIKARAR